MNDQPPLDDRDRVFPRIGDEPVQTKRRRFDILPLVITGVGILAVALLIFVTQPNFDREEGRYRLQWGQLPRCLPFGEELCNEVDSDVAAKYSDPGACRRPERVICIVPVGGIKLSTLDGIVEQLTAYLPDPVAVAPPLELRNDLLETRRRQYDGEAIANVASATYSATLGDDGALIIAVTAADIYLPSRETWRYAFGVLMPAGGRTVTSVVSTARMSYVDYYRPVKLPLGADLDVLVWPGSGKVESRAYKMVLKYVGLGYFGLPLTSDPTSVMYNNILSPRDLDRMSDELPLVVHP